MLDLPNISDWRIAVFFTAFAIMFGLAMWLGGKPERIGALTLAAMATIQLALYSTISTPHWGSVDPVLLVSDLVGLAGFTYLAMHSNRLWPIPACSMSLISMMAHFPRFTIDMLGISYAQFNGVPTFAAIVIVTGGVIAHRWRTYRNGPEADWVPFDRYAYFRSIVRGEKR